MIPPDGRPRPLPYCLHGSLLLATFGCSGAPALDPAAGPPPSHLAPPVTRAHAAPSRPAPAAPERPCSADPDCGYDPARDRCTTDPRANKQPPVLDQGIVCYCEARGHACAMLRVPPVPCESDASCAVRSEPRPHPVRASAALPHERGRRCRDFTIATTCERTNICTMHPLPCRTP